MESLNAPSLIHKTLHKLPVKDQKVVQKILKNQRLSVEEGISLYAFQDLNMLGTLANWKREQLHGNKAFFIQNTHLNNTNICVLHCKFCSFRRSEGEVGAYAYSKEDIYQKIRATRDTGIREVHIVNGLHPHLKIDFYEEVLREIKKIRPDLHIKAFTSVELDFFARRDKIDIQEVLQRLKKAGLDSLPGGGAEIFSEEIRREICGEKMDSDRWLANHRLAHQMGLQSTCTMLYGHIEAYEHRIDHMDRLRRLQDETHGFTCFIPLRYHDENNPLGLREEVSMTQMMEDLRNYAISRLFLDNIPHLKAYWIMAGCDTARLALSYGCDDLDGTVHEEIITHMAGANSPVGLTYSSLVKMIQEAGRDPVERDSLYHPVTNPSLPLVQNGVAS
jgi:aminodeoxyfutalosine synthase